MILILIYPAELNIGFDPTEYTVNEGEDGNFTVVFDIPADREINVTLSRSVGTSQGWCILCFFVVYLKKKKSELISVIVLIDRLTT